MPISPASDRENKPPDAPTGLVGSCQRMNNLAPCVSPASVVPQSGVSTEKKVYNRGTCLLQARPVALEGWVDMVQGRGWGTIRT